MPRRTATIRVLCRADRLRETIDLLAWATGHPVASVKQAPANDMRWLLIRTDLEYHGDDQIILEHFGLDLIGKIAGVLSWEVVSSEVSETLISQAADVPDIGARQALLEHRLTASLASLPAPISIMRRGRGKYRWKWMDATGGADSFVLAVEAALTHTVRSYLAVQGELSPASDNAPPQPFDGADLELVLKAALLALRTPVAIRKDVSGKYVWSWASRQGQTDSFVPAVTAAIGQLMEAYVAARRQLVEPHSE